VGRPEWRPEWGITDSAVEAQAQAMISQYYAFGINNATTDIS
jgi:hypothetical protein